MEGSRKDDNRPVLVRQAVALKYDGEAGEAPQVVASGKGIIAEKIIARAVEAKVPVHTDAALAQTLSHLQVGQEIPPELYQAVAEVLAFILFVDKETLACVKP